MKTEDLKTWGLTEEQSAKVMEQFGKDITKLQNENRELKVKCSEYESSLKDVQGKLDGFKDVNVDDLKGQIATLTTQLNNEKNARAADAQKVEREKSVNEFFSSLDENGNKKYEFLNDITESFYRDKLMEELSKDSAKGKSICDIFTGLITGEDGKQKANIFVDRKQERLEAGRAKPFTQPLSGATPPGKKVSPSELMKMKNENPDLDIRQYM